MEAHPVECTLNPVQGPVFKYLATPWEHLWQGSEGVGSSGGSAVVSALPAHFHLSHFLGAERSHMPALQTLLAETGQEKRGQLL